MFEKLSGQDRTVKKQLPLVASHEVVVASGKSRSGVGTDIAKDAICLEFMIKVKGGEFSSEEVKRRTDVLAPKVTILRDVGITFYKVVAGDSLSGIKQKLSKIPEFGYLKNLAATGLSSFNLPPKFLQLGSWIPLPPKESPMKNLSERDFVEYCRAALFDMKYNGVYSREISSLLVRTSEREILAAMLAVAKAECGGNIAQFATFRYEKGHHVFSYSVFHVLMKGAGLKARQNLNMTVGQTEHPLNAAKLFLAFMIEKSHGKLESQLPLAGNYEKFATFYNGAGWPTTNPEYPLRLRQYYEQALKLIKA